MNYSLLFAVLLSALLLTDVDCTKCYVCQWSKKSGYESPFSQQGCTLEEIRKYPKHYVEECGDNKGCSLTQWFEGDTLIGEERNCGTSSANRIQKTRYCRTNDCTKTASGAGTSDTNIKCRTVSTQLTAEILSTTPTACTPSDATRYHAFCKRTADMVDQVLYDEPNTNYPEPDYILTCIDNVNKLMYPGTEYSKLVKTCKNSLCNNDPAAVSSQLQMSMAAILGGLIFAFYCRN